MTIFFFLGKTFRKQLINFENDIWCDRIVNTEKAQFLLDRRQKRCDVRNTVKRGFFETQRFLQNGIEWINNDHYYRER